MTTYHDDIVHSVNNHNYIALYNDYYITTMIKNYKMVALSETISLYMINSSHIVQYNIYITAKHYDLKGEPKFVFEHVRLWPFAEASLRQRDLSFVPSCKTETWDLGGGCMDCQAPSLDLYSSPGAATSLP